MDKAPSYANAVGVAVQKSPDGTVHEVQMDFVLHHTAFEVRVAPTGPVQVCAPAVDHVASVLLNPLGVVTLLRGLRSVFGDEFDRLIEASEVPGA